MGHLHFGHSVVPAVQLAVTKPSSRDTAEHFTRLFSTLYLNDAENPENSQIWLGRFPTRLFISPFFVENYLDGGEPMSMSGAVPHLLGPGLGRLVWLLSPVIWSLWANSSFREQFTDYSKLFGAQRGDGHAVNMGSKATFTAAPSCHSKESVHERDTQSLYLCQASEVWSERARKSFLVRWSNSGSFQRGMWTF